MTLLSMLLISCSSPEDAESLTLEERAVPAVENSSEELSEPSEPIQPEDIPADETPISESAQDPVEEARLARLVSMEVEQKFSFQHPEDWVQLPMGDQRWTIVEASGPQLHEDARRIDIDHLIGSGADGTRSTLW